MLLTSQARRMRMRPNAKLTSEAISTVSTMVAVAM